jgi:long-subunit acyl-CoA synthetase (AMP-forming)
LPQNFSIAAAVRAINESGKQVKRNRLGAVQIRELSIFERYFNNDSAISARMTADSWFDTGDLGMLDTEGSLNIFGRTKEFLIINGQKYSPFEL